jgi:hypothetical protein
LSKTLKDLASSAGAKIVLNKLKDISIGQYDGSYVESTAPMNSFYEVVIFW